jgi:outer membrane protein insertion porin family
VTLIHRSRWLVSLIVAVFALSGWCEAVEPPPVSKVKSIDIRGNKRIETPSIIGRLTLKVNDPYMPETVRGQVKILYESGFFEDVQVETDVASDGTAVVFVVREKPFITEIVYDGNQHLSDDKLKEKTLIKSQSFLDQQQVRDSAENIRMAYEKDGYHNCQVTPVVQTLDQERKRLTFFVTEGDKAQIKTVTFDGLRTVTKAEMFKVITTREWVPWYGLFTRFTLPSLISDAGVLKREELTNDVERIREVLLNKGYFNARVSLPSVELTEDKRWFTVTFTIFEGEPFTIGEVGFRGYTVFEDLELREGLRIKQGEIFQRAKLRDEISRLTDLYGAKGYSFAEVTPSAVPNNEERTVSVIFSIKEGEMMRIRQINIVGNNKTRDNVIRREIRLDEQDVIDTQSLKRSYQRLNNLNVFETVEILPDKVSADKVDLNVRVKEKPTGQFSLGGGFSSLDRLMAIANITEGNIGGYGIMGRVSGQLGQRRSLGSITLRNPYVNDSLTSLQLDAYRSLTNYLSFFESRTGASVTVGRWLSEYNSGSISIFGEELNYRSPGVGVCTTVTADFNGKDFCDRLLGYQTTTGFRINGFRDTRDYYLDPRSGWRVGGGVDIGTPLMGGTNNFIKYSADVIKVTPLPFDFRLSIRGRFGAVDSFGGKPVPLSERFYVGGINTMRGFQFGRAGPIVPSTRTTLGATKQLIFNVDLVFTISADAKLNGVLFFDYGKGFDENESLSIVDLRKSAGLEGRWISPFGPIRAAYGINLEPRTGEKSGYFEFTIGSIF